MEKSKKKDFQKKENIQLPGLVNLKNIYLELRIGYLNDPLLKNPKLFLFKTKNGFAIKDI